MLRANLSASQMTADLVFRRARNDEPMVKVGLERLIYTMAQEHSAIYGLLSILIALAAGWLASTFFRLVFR